MRFPAEIKTGAAGRIVPTLRQEREEWGTHLVWSCPRLKGRATRHKRLVEELLRINRTEGHVRDILIRALGRVAQVFSVAFLSRSETVGAPSLRFWQGRVRCCL
jgi:hypothetical protein